MSYVAIIDTPTKKVEVRADLADQYEVCPACNGAGTRSHCHYWDPLGRRNGLIGVWTPDAYYCAGCCGQSIVRRVAHASAQASGEA